MGKYITIKISKETLKRLQNLVGELTQQKGQSVSLEEAIIEILDEYNRDKEVFGKRAEDREKDRQQLLSLMQQRVEGAGPEDFLEYDYEDVSG